MAQQSGPAKWIADADTSAEELKDIQEQVKQFADAHRDVIEPVVNRIDELKASGVGDDMLMFSATLLSIGNRLIQYVRAAEAAARGNGEKDGENIQ